MSTYNESDSCILVVRQDKPSPCKFTVHKDKEFVRDQKWHSGDSTHFPPMWPGFKSWTQCRKCTELAVGSRSCSEGFSLSYPVSFPPHKPTLQILDAQTFQMSLSKLFCVSWVNKNHIYILHFFLISLHFVTYPKPFWHRLSNHV